MTSRNNDPRVALVAQAVAASDRASVHRAFEGLSPDAAKTLTRAVTDRLAEQARRKGSWATWAASAWLLPRLPDEVQACRELQHRFDAAVRAKALPQRHADPRRRDIARTALRLLRNGLGARDVMQRLHVVNETLAEPLPPDRVDALALWAAQQLRRVSDAT